MKSRNQYLYRQGEPVSGIFLILSGQVRRIKELWTMSKEQENANQGAKETP